MEKRREFKDTEEPIKLKDKNEISPITLKIDKNIWKEFKKKVPRDINLNHAIEYLIAKFVFIDKQELKNYLPINNLYEKILTEEKNFILLFDEDHNGMENKK